MFGPWARVSYSESLNQSCLRVGDNAPGSCPEFVIWMLDATQLRELAAQCVRVAERIEKASAEQLEAEGGAA